MKTSTALITAIGATAALATPIKRQTESNNVYMHVMSIRSGSPIMYEPFTASGQKIFLGGTTASYCPESVVSDCPPGNTTSFRSYNGRLSMGTEVPGGQLVYIDSCSGALGFTQAHSGAVPEGAILDGWSIEDGVAAEGVLSRLSWESGLIACPVDGKPPYQVFAQVEGIEFGSDCLGFDALFTNSSEPSAWQYT